MERCNEKRAIDLSCYPHFLVPDHALRPALRPIFTLRDHVRTGQLLLPLSFRADHLPYRWPGTSNRERYQKTHQTIVSGTKTFTDICVTTVLIYRCVITPILSKQ